MHNNNMEIYYPPIQILYMEPQEANDKSNRIRFLIERGEDNVFFSIHVPPGYYEQFVETPYMEAVSLFGIILLPNIIFFSIKHFFMKKCKKKGSKIAISNYSFILQR